MSQKRKSARVRADVGTTLIKASPSEPRGEAEERRRGSAQIKAPRRGGHSPLLMPLHGAENGDFELVLLNEVMDQFHRHWKPEHIFDDFAFPAALRWYGAMYSFLGAAHFQRELAREIDVVESTVSRWLSGQSAPAPTVRGRALEAAERLVASAEKVRRAGAQIWDLAQQR